MKYQAVFSKYGEHIHVPVDGGNREAARDKAREENPMLASWPLVIKSLPEGRAAKDDRATLEFVEPRKPGRPKRLHGYERITLEIREDLLAKIDASGKSRREYIEQLLEK